MRVLAAVLSILGLAFAAPAHAATYNVDKDHSSVTFKIKHMLSHVTGTFNDFSGTIQYEPGKPETWSAQGTIQTASIDTNHEKRDAHLKNPDFFDVEKYPTIEFKTTGAQATGENTAKVDGLLTMHGVEKPVTLDVTIHGVADDPWGGTKAGFTAVTTLKRSDFGIVWNQPLNAGGFLLGEDVQVTLEIEAGLAKEAAAAQTSQKESAAVSAS